MALLMACPFAALGQESRPETPARSGPSSVPRTEIDGPAEIPDVMPEKRLDPIRPGLGPLTPEQHEEAERLRKLAAKYGIDPTAIVGRVQFSSQYLNLPRGGHDVLSVARVDLPFQGNFLFRVDAPILKWKDSDRPATTTQGVSDLAVLAGWRAYNTAEYALFIGSLVTMPTATETSLGFGKYTVGPSLAMAWFIPQWESSLTGLFTQQVSVGGDPARKSVNLSKATSQIITFWPARWWSTVQAVWQVDWERSAKSSMLLEFELGRNVVGSWGVFIRPGVGIWGQDLIGAYDWNIESGIRYMFTSF